MRLTPDSATLHPGYIDGMSEWLSVFHVPPGIYSGYIKSSIGLIVVCLGLKLKFIVFEYLRISKYGNDFQSIVVESPFFVIGQFLVNSSSLILKL